MTLRLPGSRRARSVAAVVVAALAWAAVSACNQTTINTPLRSFDRPSDVALTCVQYNPLDYDKDQRPHGTYNVRPIGDCEPVAANKLAITVPPNYGLPVNYVPPLGPSNFTPFLVALVPQSARGELAFVDTAQSRLVDLDPYTPGFGFIPVGKLPEHVRTSKDGCWGITANSNSCDLSRVDVSTVIHASLASLFPAELAAGASAGALGGVKEMPLSVPSATAGGAPKILYARPSWIEMAPENDNGGMPSKHGYEDGGTPGFCSGGDHRAWVALPGCQLVVKVLLEAPERNKATIEKALRVDDKGVTEVTDLSTIDCPVECAGGNGDVASSDAGAPPLPTDMGASNLPSPPAWPATLAVDAEADVAGVARAGRLIIGDGYGDRLDIIPFDVASAAIGTPQSVTLQPDDNNLLQTGVRTIRVGPRTPAGKFLYAVARDGSVRVVDLDRNAECETNPDPRWKSPTLDLQERPIRPADKWIRPSTGQPWETSLPPPRALGCFPIGDPATPRRSVFATSPGIALPPGEVPSDVAFVHVDAPPGDPNNTVAPVPASPGVLVGDFAWIITSDGKGTVVDIYDACPQPNQQDPNRMADFTPVCDPGNVQISLTTTVAQFGHPQPRLYDLVSHRIRNGHPRFFNPASASDSTGESRVPDPANPCAVAVPPTSPGLPDGGVPDAGGCGSTTGNLPSLYAEPVPAVLLPTQGETRVVYFVDPIHVRDETWVLSWEGVLAGSDRATGAPLVVPGNPPTTQDRAYLSDSGGAWCGRGVLAGDKVIFRGCTVDAECDSAAGFQCVHDPGAFADVSQGMCLHIGKNADGSEDTVDRWAMQCGDLLRSQRKFRILSAKQGAVVPSGATPSPPPPAPPAPTPPGGTVTDLLELAEIYEPEFSEETHTCNVDSDCKDVQVFVQPDNTPRGTACLPDADGQKRCILSCNPKPDPMIPEQKTLSECGFDFECVQSAFGDDRCMRAPIGGPTHWQLCMPELQDYEVHVGDAFTVSGTSSGYLSNEIAGPGGECVVPPQTIERARLTQWRVPLTAPACPPNISLDNGTALTESIDPAVLPRNVCAVKTTAPGVGLIHFENPIFNIVVQLPLSALGKPLVPPDGTAVSMQVVAGGNSLQSLLGVDVQSQQPRYVAVAPDNQTVYVVDEGKSPVATGLRGQLLRLFSPSQSIDTTFVVR